MLVWLYRYKMPQSAVIFSVIWPGNVPLVPYHEPIADYRRCYDIAAAKGGFFVGIQLNPLPAYDCITTMELSLNVSGVESCNHFTMYKADDNYLVWNSTTMAECIQTAEESRGLGSFCQYRCEPTVNLMFGWSDLSRLQNMMTICDLRWNYGTC